MVGFSRRFRQRAGEPERQTRRLSGGALTAHNAQVEAVQLLMGINRQIYFDCPIVPSFSERCRALLHIGTV